jgi:hypothetical protein
MSDEPKKRSWAWVGWTTLVLALYVLSAGPAAYLWSHEIVSEPVAKAIGWFYFPTSPLTWFELYRRYLNFFIWH